MKKFILKLLLLFAPFAIGVFGVPVMTFLRSGEFLTMHHISGLQRSSEHLVLYGPAYAYRVRRLKFQTLLDHPPQVMALGSSRVLQIRSKFFKDSRSFYNAGGMIDFAWALRALMNQIPVDKHPKMIILGLDQYLYNPNFSMLRGGFGVERAGDLTVFANNWKKVREDYAQDKFLLRNLKMKNKLGEIAIGVNAIINRNGFRNDGSYFFGRYFREPTNSHNEDQKFENTLERINKGIGRFEYSNQISSDAVEELDTFLREAHDRGIHVVGFLPPYAHVVFQTMKSMKDKYSYIDKLREDLSVRFNKYGFSFFDFSDLAAIGSSDAEVIDGFHASEKAYLRLFLKMMEKDPKLMQVAADRDFLVQRLNRSKSPFIVFNNNEI